MSNSLGDEDLSGYRYSDADIHASHTCLLPKLLEILAETGHKRLFELGCGSGAIAGALAGKGYEVVGIDASSEGIEQANRHYPHLRLEKGSVYDDLAGKYGRFPVVLSLEVVEHLYFPRKFARTTYDLLTEGGTAIISTPYHGYLKNLALALTGRMDQHFTALWDHGHIKFWSPATISKLMAEAGFKVCAIHRVGRIGPLARSMMLVATKPLSGEQA